jgi:FAD/FMN-containing dehydrogenase
MLSAFEVMWADYWHAATVTVKGVRPPIAGQHAFYVLVEMQGLDAEIDGARFERWIEAAFDDGTIEDAAIAQSVADMAAFWRTRDAAGEFTTFLGPHVAYDVGLAVRDMDSFALACRRGLAAILPDVRSVYYGHIADGNMHIVALVPGAMEQPTSSIDAVIYDTVRSFGGTISAEHGIGLKKRAYLGYTRSPEEISLMARLKGALDPANLLNPGKVVDSVERHALPDPQRLIRRG